VGLGPAKKRRRKEKETRGELRTAAVLLERSGPADVSVDTAQADHVALALACAEMPDGAVALDVHLARAGLHLTATEGADRHF